MTLLPGNKRHETAFPVIGYMPELDLVVCVFCKYAMVYQFFFSVLSTVKITFV